MPDPKECDDAARRYFEQMTPERHKEAYAQLFYAYINNFDEGRPRKVEEYRDQMSCLLTFGKISDADRLAIEAKTLRLRAELRSMKSGSDPASEEQLPTTLH
jgi:hypothetical protein